MTRRVTVPCPRYVKTLCPYDTEDWKYPRSVSERELYATIPKHVADECYVECGGAVPVTRAGGFGMCDECHCADWTTHETAALTAALPPTEDA